MTTRKRTNGKPTNVLKTNKPAVSKRNESSPKREKRTIKDKIKEDEEFQIFSEKEIHTELLLPVKVVNEKKTKYRRMSSLDEKELYYFFRSIESGMFIKDILSIFGVSIDEYMKIKNYKGEDPEILKFKMQFEASESILKQKYIYFLTAKAFHAKSESIRFRAFEKLISTRFPLDFGSKAIVQTRDGDEEPRAITTPIVFMPEKNDK